MLSRFLYAISLPQFFYDRDGGGPTGDPKPGEGDGDPKPPVGDGDPKPPGDPTISMSPDAFNDRLARAKDTGGKNAVAALLKQFGIKDAETLGSIVEKHHEHESEAEKIQRELATLQAERTQLAEENARYAQQSKARTIDDTISGTLEKLARESNLKVLEGYHAPVSKLVRERLDIRDGAPVVLTEAGEVDHGTNPEGFIKTFLEAHKAFLEPTVKTGGAGSHPTPGARGQTDKDLETDPGPEGRAYRWNKIVGGGQ